MGLLYRAGDIVYFKNVIFNDSNGKKQIDRRISGHPFLVLNDVEDFGDKCYALKITSRELDQIKQYTLETNATVPRLRKKSYVNLNKMFEFNIDKNIVSYCFLKDKHFIKVCQMVNKFNH